MFQGGNGTWTYQETPMYSHHDRPGFERRLCSWGLGNQNVHSDTVSLRLILCSVYIKLGEDLRLDAKKKIDQLLIFFLSFGLRDGLHGCG